MNLDVKEQIKIALLLFSLVMVAYFFGMEVGEYGERIRAARRETRRMIDEFSLSKGASNGKDQAAEPGA